MPSATPLRVLASRLPVDRVDKPLPGHMHYLRARGVGKAMFGREAR